MAAGPRTGRPRPPGSRPDPAAVALDDPRRDRQAEAGAAARRAGRPPEALEHVGQVLGADAGPSSSTSSAARAAVGAAPDPDPAAGRAVADRVVDEDHHQLAQAGRVAARRPPAPGRPRSGRRGRRPACRAPRRAVGRDVAEVERHPRRARRPRNRSGRAAAGPRRCEVRWSTSASMSSSAVADRADRLARGGAAGARRCCGRRSAASAARGWRPPRTRAGGAARRAGWRATRGSGRARAARRRPRTRARRRRRPAPPTSSTASIVVERPLLGRPVLDDLDDVDAARATLDRLGQDPDRRAVRSTVVRMSAPVVRRGGRSPAAIGQARRRRRSRAARRSTSPSGRRAAR